MKGAKKTIFGGVRAMPTPTTVFASANEGAAIPGRKAKERAVTVEIVVIRPARELNTLNSFDMQSSGSEHLI